MPQRDSGGLLQSRKVHRFRDFIVVLMCVTSRTVAHTHGCTHGYAVLAATEQTADTASFDANTSARGGPPSDRLQGRKEVTALECKAKRGVTGEGHRMQIAVFFFTALRLEASLNLPLTNVWSSTLTTP
ncbi:hypothetical protein CSUI_002904 [Cystoisospora suis]|uniref:Uncharacterized protein n=1 Tax=Cystoisospora suis TaxID=483139 RepID=A0A2C6L6Y9_9APIC|nr:hypothetical protein CSUI_002904 [Cystoisospora suis]